MHSPMYSGKKNVRDTLAFYSCLETTIPIKIYNSQVWVPREPFVRELVLEQLKAKTRLTCSDKRVWDLVILSFTKNIYGLTQISTEPTIYFFPHTVQLISTEQQCCTISAENLWKYGTYLSLATSPAWTEKKQLKSAWLAFICTFTIKEPASENYYPTGS